MLKLSGGFVSAGKVCYMKLYQISFNEYTNNMMDTIGAQTDIQPRYIAVTKTASGSYLYVAANNISELEIYEQYGRGIKTLICLGGIICHEEKSII